MSFQKSIYKPTLYKRELCNMLKVPYRPHYKCYLKQKLGNLAWRDRKKLKDYMHTYMEQINGRSQRYRNYYLSQWDFQYYLRNFIELNPVEVAEKAINIELNYSEDQIYYKMKEELSIDMEI
jgi:hypothetical protein